MKKEYLRPNASVIEFEQELLSITSLHNEKGGPAEDKYRNSTIVADEIEDDFWKREL